MRNPAKIGLAVTTAILALLVSTAPLSAQFEEPDTLPRFSIGIFGDLSFRGKRGETASGVEVGFTNSPSGGLRFDYRLGQTLTLAAFGDFTRLQEKLTDQMGNSNVGASHLNLFRFGGELLLRVKPRIPGYFVLGGGLQYVNARTDDAQQLTRNENFSEPFGIAGAGYEFASTRKRAFRINFRLYLVSPSEQERYDPKSVEIDFMLGAAFILRL